MPAPAFNLAVTGTDPKVTTREILNAEVNRVVGVVYDEFTARASDLEGKFTQKNLFISSEATDGVYLATDGSTFVSPTMTTSAPIAVEPSQTYTGESQTRNIERVVERNAAGVVVGHHTGVKTFTTSATTTQVRVSARIAEKATFQFEKGSVATAYEEGTISRLAPAVKPAAASVGAAETDFFERTRNLIDLSKMVDGYVLNSDGTTSASANFSYTAKMQASSGQQYIANSQIRIVMFYDANGATIPAARLDNVSAFTVPSGAVAFALTFLTVNKPGFMLMLGAALAPYEPYGFKPKASTPSGAFYLPAASVARPESYGLSRLRETRQRLRMLREGQGGRISIGMIGDSWTHNASRWSGKFAETLWRKYNADEEAPLGRGWIGFATGGDGMQNGSITGNNQVTATGTWTQQYTTGSGPDAGAVVSSAADAQQSLALDYTKALTWKLFAQGGAGVIRYRWTAAGAWTTIDLSALGAGFQAITLAGAPASGTGTFTVEVVSGTAKLYGLFESKSGDGVIAHKLAATGSQAQQWAALDAAIWQPSIAALGCNLITIMHGTNDQGANRSASAFKANLITIIDRVRTALPLSDILLIAPPENQRTNLIKMADYAQAMYEIALTDRDVAYGDLQPHFGLVPADYASTSARDWFNADGIHPSPVSGVYAMLDPILGWTGERSA